MLIALQKGRHMLFFQKIKVNVVLHAENRIIIEPLQNHYSRKPTLQLQTLCCARHCLWQSSGMLLLLFWGYQQICLYGFTCQLYLNDILMVSWILYCNIASINKVAFALHLKVIQNTDWILLIQLLSKQEIPNPLPAMMRPDQL